MHKEMNWTRDCVPPLLAFNSQRAQSPSWQGRVQRARSRRSPTTATREWFALVPASVMPLSLRESTSRQNRLSGTRLVPPGGTRALALLCILLLHVSPLIVSIIRRLVACPRIFGFAAATAVAISCAGRISPVPLACRFVLRGYRRGHRKVFGPVRGG